MSPRPKSAVARPGRAARARAAALRNQLLQSVFLPLRQDRTAQLRYAAILDGHTVNLHARLPESVSLPRAPRSSSAAAGTPSPRRPACTRAGR